MTEVTLLPKGGLPARLLSSARNLRWLAWTALGLLLLPGRYVWSGPSAPTSWRGLICSAFFLCLVVPLLSTLLDKFAGDTPWPNAFVGTATVVLTLPYQWLGLYRFYYHRNKPGWIDWSMPSIAPPSLPWLTRTSVFAPLIPGQAIFFLILLGIIASAACLYMAVCKRRGQPVSLWQVLFGIALIAIILPETWLHLSMRSPYTYANHFSKPAAANFWYHVNLFPDGSGAINSDYFLFRSIEELFMGSPRAVDGMLVNRAFPLYLTSQFSYFINPFYVTIGMNLLCWLAAVLAVGSYVAVQFDRRIAIVAALLTASAPGFIAFVGGPPSYLWGFTAAAVTIWAHWKICCQSESSVRDYVTFGFLLALALLTYDLFSLFAYFVGYEVFCKKSYKRIALSGGIAIAVYSAFVGLTQLMPTIIKDDRNTKYVSASFHNGLAALGSFPVALRPFEFYTALLPSYLHNLGSAMLVFPVFLAIAGVLALRNLSELRLIALLLLPSVVNFGLLYVGQTELAGMPRFQFIAYIGIYVLCGIAAVRLAELSGKLKQWAVPIFGVATVAANIALSNIDVFGYPWLYFFFFYHSDPGMTF